MPSEKEIAIIQKALLYDLIKIIEADPEKTYTSEELKKLFDAYMSGAEQ